MVDIRTEYPPNIDVIKDSFPLTGREIFAWDGIIYNPSGANIPSELIAHEEVHFKQQDGDPEGWWKRYIDDMDFRLDQELEAHRIEYRTFCRLNKDRNRKAMYLNHVASRLSGPLYGRILTLREAIKQIKR